MASRPASSSRLAITPSAIPRGDWPWANRGDAVPAPPGALYQAIAEAGIDTQAAKVGGPPIENVAIDEEGEKTFARLSGLATLLGLGLAWWSLRSVRLTLIVFVCSFMSAFPGAGHRLLDQQEMDAVMMAMPTLVYVLAVSGSVHIINYYRDAVPRRGYTGRPGAHPGPRLEACGLVQRDDLDRPGLALHQRPGWIEKFSIRPSA